MCRDTVYDNISGKTDDLLSNAELHKNKTIQKKNTEKESWIGYQLCCRVQRPPRTCREPVCFTAHAGGKQRHLVVKLTSVFGSLRDILLEKTSTQSTSLLSALRVFAMPRVTSSIDCSGGGSFGGSDKGEAGTALRSGRGLLGEARLTGEGSSIFLREQRKKRTQRGNTGRCTKCHN